jgi:hypothetical protein
MARGRSGGISQFIELVGQEQVREGFLSLGKIGEQSMQRSPRRPRKPRVHSSN